MLRNKYRRLNENGFASIVIALILIVVLALLTVGFAQLSRREQRSALNKQLANQAYYAAESGINDVAEILPDIADSTPPDKDKCLTPTQLTNYGLDPKVNPSRGVSYSCVLLDLKPKTLLYDNVSPMTDRYVTFSTSPTPLDSLTIKWGSADNHHAFLPSVSGFKPLGASGWGDAPAVLKVSITPVPEGSISRSSLVNGQFTVYLYPSTNAGSATYSTADGQQGRIVPGNCHAGAKYTCSATINGLGVAGTQAYILSITDYYDPSNINITGKSGVTSISFIGAQAQVDVTGKAQEVLKRLRVHIPVHSSYDFAASGVEAQDLCKRFTTDPTAAAGFDTALSPACRLDN
jgi:hypothetical protein